VPIAVSAADIGDAGNDEDEDGDEEKVGGGGGGGGSGGGGGGGGGGGDGDGRDGAGNRKGAPSVADQAGVSGDSAERVDVFVARVCRLSELLLW